MSESALPVWVTGVSAQQAGEVGANVIIAGAWGILSFALYTGKYIVTKSHPVLGTLAAFFALGGTVNAVRVATNTEA